MTSSIYLLFFLGLGLIGYGANLLVTSTENISRKFNISHFIASFVFIGLATSAPEIFISILSSINGKANIAIGNALGSNIANIALVFAVTILFIKATDIKNNRIVDKEVKGFFIFLIILTVFIQPILIDGIIQKYEALLLLGLFLILVFLYKYYYYTKQNINEAAKKLIKQINGWRITATLLFGLFLLLSGTKIFLDSSITIAKSIGISDYVIGLSITAVGTSIPELASSIESARKKNVDFIVGNILGSNIFNTGIVVSLAGLFSYGLPNQLNQMNIIRDIIMILITIIGFYIIIKNYTNSITKILCVLLLTLFFVYQISLYDMNI
tara:strand:- start:206 stop:1183 length:978 start_codon:yes stop_codon:yes gene_type:complete